MDEEEKKAFVIENLQRNLPVQDIQLALTLSELTKESPEKILALQHKHWKYVQDNWREHHGIRGQS